MLTAKNLVDHADLTASLPSPMEALRLLPSDAPESEERTRTSAPELPALRLSACIAQAAEMWHLSRRQREVLALAIQGFSNRQMAEELGCATKTIEAHVTGLLKKAGVARRNELVAKLIHAYT